jgi:RNA recognition motif-containing protein
MPVLLIIDNLPHGLGETEFVDLFSPFGRILMARLVRDRQGTFLGFGFVQLEAEDPASVISQLDGKEIHGQLITVRVLESSRPSDTD